MSGRLYNYGIQCQHTEGRWNLRRQGYLEHVRPKELKIDVVWDWKRRGERNKNPETIPNLEGCQWAFERIGFAFICSCNKDADKYVCSMRSWWQALEQPWKILVRAFVSLII